MSAPVNIVFVVTRADEIGGAQVHVRDLSVALRRRGWDVSVVSGSQGVLSEDLARHGVPFHSIPNLVRPVRPRSDLQAVLELRRFLREWKPDLVSLHSSKAGVLGRLAMAGLGVPTLFTAHGWGFSSSNRVPVRGVLLLIERCMSPLADRIIAVSEADRSLAIRLRLARADQITTVHNGMPDVSRDLRSKPEASPPHVAMVARFAAPKDQALLLRALAGLTDLEWQMSLIGEGPRLEAARRLATELQIASRVNFTGFRRDVAELLAESQVFVLASNSEAFPRSILEASRAGLPIVASDVGGVRESVADGKTGFVVPTGDLEALRLRLRALLGDRDLRARLGDASRQRYERLFTFERMVERTINVYEELLGRDLSGGTD